MRGYNLVSFILIFLTNWSKGFFAHFINKTRTILCNFLSNSFCYIIISIKTFQISKSLIPLKKRICFHPLKDGRVSKRSFPLLFLRINTKNIMLLKLDTAPG